MAITILKLIKPRIVFRHFLVRRTSSYKLSERDTEEIQIPVPWGHISGKWWGSRSKQPILCMHGWQDNANSFDTLIPQLPSEFSYLAIDLPGHGLSSHFPKGSWYKTCDSLTTIRRIQQHFQWKTISLIGHSLGGILSFSYSSVFSNDVKFFVAIDEICPVHRNLPTDIKNGSDTVEKILKYDSLHISDAVKYTEDDLIKLWLKATNNSITEQSCKILMQRGASEKNGVFTLRRDSKLKNNFLGRISKEQTLKLAENLSCSVLYIKAIDWPNFRNDVIDVVQMIKKKAKYFEEHKLPGTHHLHLNTPEVVSPVISAFITSISAK